MAVITRKVIQNNSHGQKMITGCMHIILVTAPLIALWSLHHVSVYRIQMDIAAYFQHPLFRCNRLIIIPFFKDMAGDSILRVVIVSIPLVDEGHHFGNRLFFGAYLQVKMVGHQTVGSEFKWGFLIGLLEYTEENFEITIVFE